jgi:hypothetical protein
MGKDLVFLGTYLRRSPGGDEEEESRWQVWELSDGRFLVQRLSLGGEGMGIPEAVDERLFFREFRVQTAFTPGMQQGGAGQRREESAPVPPVREETARPAVFRSIFDETDLLYPGGKKGQKAPAPAARAWKEEAGEEEIERMLYPRREVPQAEYPSPARDAGMEDVRQVEKQMRSDFSIALIRLRNNRDQALESLNRILEYKAPFQKEHKHMFSDFGTALRRRRLHSMACRFHERAKELAPDDEHILFNLARALYDSGKFAQAAEHLQAALSMSRHFKPGADFLEYIQRRKSL